MSGFRLELLAKDAPAGTRVVILCRDGLRVDYTRCPPHEDPVHGWFVSVGSSITYSKLAETYALPDSALEERI